MKKNIFKILVIALVISAIFGITIIVFDLWGETTIKVLATTASIFGFSIPGLCCSTVYENDKLKKFSIAGMITCLLGCIYCLMLVWGMEFFDSIEEITWKLILSFVLLSSSFGHISLLLSIKSNDKKVSYIRLATIILSVVLDAILIFEIFSEATIEDKVISVLAILIALGTIVVPIMNKISKKDNHKIKNDDKYEKLEKLKKLLDDNVITEEEYNKEKSKILDEDV